MKVPNRTPERSVTDEAILATLTKFQEGIREELKDIATVETCPAVSWTLSGIPTVLRAQWTDLQVSVPGVDRITLTFTFQRPDRVVVAPVGYTSKLSRAWRGEPKTMCEALRKYFAHVQGVKQFVDAQKLRENMAREYVKPLFPGWEIHVAFSRDPSSVKGSCSLHHLPEEAVNEIDRVLLARVLWEYTPGKPCAVKILSAEGPALKREIESYEEMLENARGYFEGRILSIADTVPRYARDAGYNVLEPRT